MRDATALVRLDWQMRVAGIPEPVREYRGIAGRRYRFDRAWPDRMLALEYEGLAWAGGKSRHTTPRGYASDCAKYNEAMLAGWRVLRVTAPHVASGEALQWIERALGCRSSGRPDP